jgi:hypothetical protein
MEVFQVGRTDDSKSPGKTFQFEEEKEDLGGWNSGTR